MLLKTATVNQSSLILPFLWGKEEKKKHGKAVNAKKLRNNPIDPNSPNYGSQLLKQQLKNKFAGYEYGLSDW